MDVIGSTIELQSLSDLQWDVVVIGAGPAGSVAALQLARNGAKVLLVDKAEHPRFKVCGCCLSNASVQLLDSIGLKERLLALNAVPINKLAMHVKNRRADITLSPGLGLSRQTLDSEIIRQAIAAGAGFLSSTSAFVGVEESDHRLVDLECKNANMAVRAKCVLVADGLGGRALDKLPLLPITTAEHSRIGAGTSTRDFPKNLFDDGCIYMTAGEGGYVGMVKIEDGSLDIAAAFDRQFVQRFKSPGDAASELIKLTPLAQLNLASLHWHGTPSLTRRRGVYASRLFVVGDAASYAEPFTGEGMLWAMTSGCAVVPLVLSALQSECNFDYSEWATVHRQLISGKQVVSLALARMLRQPLLIESIIRFLNVAPFLARPIVKSIQHQPSLLAVRRAQTTVLPRV